MARTRTRDLIMVTLDKGIELYLTTLATEGKSPRYIDWIKTRLKFFSEFMRNGNGDNFNLQDLRLEDGREFIKSLMERDTCYKNHPMHLETRVACQSK